MVTKTPATRSFRRVAWLASATALLSLFVASKSSAQAKAKPPPIDPSDTLTIPVPGTAPSASTTAPPPKKDEPPPALPAGAETPRVHHAPVATAAPHETLEISAAIDSPQLVKRALVVYKTAEGKTKEVPFLRGKGELYIANVPGDDVFPPSLAYAIELEQTDGTRVNAFATRDAMHDVSVSEDVADTRERALLDLLGGRRAVFGGSFDYVYFGKKNGVTLPEIEGGSPVIKNVADGYLRTEGSFTYRPLRTVLEFSLRGGIVRGTSNVPDAKSFEDTKVGLNYGAATVIFRLHDLFHVEMEGLTSVTEVGFSGGVGGAIHIGEPYGSKLVVGFETVKTFGSRGYARLDIMRNRFRVSPLVEVTDMPHADKAGVRLVTELGINMGAGWGLLLRGGYQARDFNNGGPGGGVSISYAF